MDFRAAVSIVQTRIGMPIAMRQAGRRQEVAWMIRGTTFASSQAFACA